MAEAITDLDDDAERVRTGWHRWLGWGAAAIIFSVLVGLIVALALSNNQRDRALGWQRYSYELIVAVRGIEGQMAQAEATLGRAVIASDKDLARRYYDEWRRAGLMINRLERNSRENPDQLVLVRNLNALYAKRGDELEEAVLHLNYNQNVKALSVYFAAGKSESLDRIRAIFREIIANEQTLLTERTGEASDFVAKSNRLTAVLAALGLALVVGAIGLGWAMIEAMAQRRRAGLIADVEAQRAEILEAAVNERTQELQRANQQLMTEAAERAHAEAQLRQVQKMEAVGQLTGGIAHDFNNMLAVVVGGLELAKSKLHDRAEDAMRHIDNAMEGANRAAALTRRLLAFARAEPLLPQSISPETLIVGMRDLMDRTLGERVRVEVSSVPGQWQIWVDRHQLENAILNLAVNARDAMEGDGKLTIQTSNCVLAEGEIGESAAGEYVRIDVSDTGCGMDKAVLERVFEPFFTTKPVGKGTGLGLSQIFGFIRQSGGEIAISSAVGIGTTVSLYLPRHQAATAQAPVGTVFDTPANVIDTLEERTALVVEDDPRVLAATAAALEELGVRTIRSSSAEEAIGILERNAAIDIIVSDVIMPGMTGPEFIATVSPLYPHLAVLFVTGYADVSAADAFGGNTVLRKPFTITALGNAVKTALAARMPSAQPPEPTAVAAA